eukprot:6142147-Prymnesium_polylepis.1
MPAVPSYPCGHCRQFAEYKNRTRLAVPSNARPAHGAADDAAGGGSWHPAGALVPAPAAAAASMLHASRLGLALELLLERLAQQLVVGLLRVLQPAAPFGRDRLAPPDHVGRNLCGVREAHSPVGGRDGRRRGGEQLDEEDGAEEGARRALEPRQPRLELGPQPARRRRVLRLLVKSREHGERRLAREGALRARARAHSRRGRSGGVRVVRGLRGA